MDGGPVSERDEALDAVRGILVLLMLLYHWLNYFVQIEWDVYRYLRFLTPSFILITGFLIPRVYVARYGWGSRSVSRRLTQRGLKLLLLFLVLNLLSGRWHVASGGTAANVVTFWREAFSTGLGPAAFGVLVPIGYLLILTPFVLSITRGDARALWVVATSAVVMSIGAGAAGIKNVHGELVGIGLIGLASGAMEPRYIEALISRIWWLVVAYLLYLVAITIWNVRFLLQVCGVCVSVLLLYGGARHVSTTGCVRSWLVEIGRYSLYAYVAQIVLLQLLRRGFTSPDMAFFTLMVTLCVSVALTAASVRAVAEWRSRWGLADRVYRTIFA